MKIKDILSSSAEPFPSLEIVPPLKGMTTDELLRGLEQLMEFAPKYINVTRHRTEYEFVPNPDGSFVRREVRARMSQTEVCGSVRSHFGVDVAAHIICGGSTREDIGCELERLQEIGVDNVMALRGDCTVGEKRFSPMKGGYSFANELVEGIRARHGQDFCIGVGGYPEKHFEAPNIETDIRRLKAKVDAGADYIITQMFFDNEKYFSFVEACRAAGITVPIIPGLKPLSSARQITLLPETFSIDIPVKLSEAMLRASTKEEAYRIGADWCARQCEDLLKKGVPAVHFYTMGNPSNVREVLRRCFTFSQ